ncbi:MULTISPECIES: phosphoribosylformylglycinamidine synthase [Rikenellaceae]|uniref:Phosphoribosylformylglycinamidine synthase n=1 Tax=Alistipes inops TaxID=1501391 RepID=A0ABR4YJM5_9BACT|nr:MULTISPECIES: phosphoribosylformylglycinamidine synthase [Rikenellaceae]KHE42470.1 phosphoribosylformylglycinamidine synthase [Alistipes inops]
MESYRIYVEKKPEFRVEAQSLREELNGNLGLSLGELRLLNVYDLFGFTPELLEKSRYGVFGEVVTDVVTDTCDLTGKRYLAVEYLPGQFDQRASSAEECVMLLEPEAKVKIRSARLLIFDDGVTDADLSRIRKYYINGVESREKNLAVLGLAENAEVRPVPVLEGFTRMGEAALAPYCKANGLAMNADDLREVVAYFRREGRDPSETELRILDTYWSDHCRHTTFTTVLEEITVDESFMKGEMEESLALYRRMREELGRTGKPVCLMDMATIGARYLKKKGLLDDQEESEENNACSIFINVDVDGEPQKWLLQFKNETHNHPTEIEPFGGASTCLGGAIRDPLSGRAYVYQAMRVTGAGNIYQPVGETLEGKLPQRIISTKAAAGYSSYGNQIGLATTHVREIYHPDYVAKRLEVGAVVGAVKADNVRRESPVPGDIVLLLGGRTGRDGIGGATGSSKEHNAQSLEECGSEVQKGNAPEERKLQRLFRRPEVARLIKKSNDFGAGGVSVAIGELTDGLDIYLDRVPTKYSGLNATELAISESQERMAVVIEEAAREEFERYCAEENVEVTHVADVTDTRRMRMYHKGELIVDLSREFIDSAGAEHRAKAAVAGVERRNPFLREVAGTGIAEKMRALLSDDNVVSQKGMVEMFDSTIGASTVLMPYGGRTQQTETQVSVQKIPVGEGYTDTASIMAFGFNPFISKWSPYHGAAYAVVEAVSKAVAAGARFERMRFSYQEYFERMTDDPHTWGKPLAALLGALKMQEALGLPSIGGKDSMSGTFKDIDVPPTLIAFGITTVDAGRVISPEFKEAGHRIYLMKHLPLHNFMPDTDALKKNWEYVHREIAAGNIVSGWAVGFGGVAEAVAKMSFGNRIGAEIKINEQELFGCGYGSIVVESRGELDWPGAVELGRTVAAETVTVNGERMPIDRLLEANTVKFATVYPDRGTTEPTVMQCMPRPVRFEYPGPAKGHPVAYLPSFPGTNCDYDTAKAFRRAGAEVTTSVFRNLSGADVMESIDEMCGRIAACDIFVLSGGFSSGDEPDGSGKFIVSVLNNARVAEEIHRLLDRGGLILGICNGFQALVKSGLLPYGRLGRLTPESPTLFRNDVNRHISQTVCTRVASTNSPWLAGFEVGDLHTIAVSHGEGKFVVNERQARELFEAGQVAFQYADAEGVPTGRAPFNPNGSYYAIEGIVSRDGQILGKMGHTERYEPNLFRNIAGNKVQDIFGNAVRYFRKR